METLNIWIYHRWYDKTILKIVLARMCNYVRLYKQLEPHRHQDRGWSLLMDLYYQKGTEEIIYRGWNAQLWTVFCHSAVVAIWDC